MKRHLGSALLAVASWAVLWPGAAGAHFPGEPLYRVCASNPNGCVKGTGFVQSGYDLFGTSDAACWALVRAIDVFSPGCAPRTLVYCDPDNPAFFNVEGASTVCPPGNGAAGNVRQFATRCKPQADPLGDGRCHCKSGFIDLDGSCSAGKNNGPPPRCCGNPANIANGNKFERQPVYSGTNGFEFTLSFNTFDDYRTRFGTRWRDSFNRRVSVNGGVVFAYRPDGRTFQFSPGAGGWVADADVNDRLAELKDAAGARIGWQLYAAAGDEWETYDASGKLVSIRSRLGLTQTLAYSDGTTGPGGGYVLDANGQQTTAALPAGLLIRAADHFGRALAFGYNAASQVVRVIDPAAGEFRFAYGENHNLVSIGFPDGAVRTFVYNEAANTGGAYFPNALTGIVDENGARFANYQYDALERIVVTEHAGGAQRYTLAYGANTTTVTDPLGASRSYGFQFTLGAHMNTGVSGAACPSCGPAVQSFDASNNLSSSTDWNGNRTNYAYDLARNLEASRTEGLTASGQPTAQTRTISTEWHPALRLPKRIAEPLRITTFVYNGDGGVTCGLKADGVTPVPGVLCAKTVQATSDAGGGQGFAAAPAGAPRSWRYTYNANGLVLTADGPRTDVADVTTYAYYADDDPDLGRRGNVATITNALGHTTRIAAYNAHGQPTAIVDPNGLVTTLGYDARQRLASRTVGSETTAYAYDAVGQLVRVTLPDGSFLAYGYDAAHRLTGMADSLGNSIAYTLDAMGNRVKEDVYDPSNVLAQTRSRVYDSLNRLFREVGAAGQTTEYGYDNQGNVISVRDPLNRVTGSQYDALNRLAQVTDSNLGVTRYGYNGLDSLTSVTDPRGLVTGYAVDGLGNLIQQSSPDTGATSNGYDEAGNLAAQTDAKGQTTAYAYDALNRVTGIRFADGSTQIYVYDQGANALGRLSGITETDPASQPTGQIGYGYDPQGRVVAESRMVAGQVYTVSYGYDAAGRLAGMTYPSGRSVTYAFDGAGRIAEIATTQGARSQILVQQVRYHPFGGVKSYVLGNGQLVSRAVDLDGRIAGYTLGNESYAIAFDAASRITGISQLGNPANAGGYGYDELDRLTSAVLANAAYGYRYDAVGNRLSKSAGGSTEVYAYSPTSNRIASVTPGAGAARSFTFDANGSTTSDGVNSYAYDARGRMSGAASAAGLAFYQVNALGQRVRKTQFQGDTVFHYDVRGRLIAETDALGSLKRELFYLGDIPVAVFQ